MKSKRSSNLTLNANSRHRKRTAKIDMKYQLQMTEMYTVVKPRTKQFNTPVSSKRKRQGSKSPYITLKSSCKSSPFKRTPTKQPSAKKMRKSLLSDFDVAEDSFVKNVNTKNDTDSDFVVIQDTSKDFGKDIFNANQETCDFAINNDNVDINDNDNLLWTNELHKLKGDTASDFVLIPDTSDDLGKDIFTVNQETCDFAVNNDNVDINDSDINLLWTNALHKLKEKGLDIVLLEFFKLVSTGKFPLDNLALTLFSDVVNWYRCQSTNSMRYSRQSKVFWKLGYRLFGGRFLHFMGGPKHQGQIVLEHGEKGNLIPTTANINFAVHDVRNLRRFDSYGLATKQQCEDVFAPGILIEMVKTLADELEGYSCCLTFDGKKLKQGLTLTSGDVNLLGFETELSLEAKRQKLKNVTKPYCEISDRIGMESAEDLSDLSTDIRKSVEIELKEAIKAISLDILEVQDLRKKKSMPNKN